MNSTSAFAGAHVSKAEGIVELRHTAGPGWTPARALERLEAGDRLRTGLGAAAAVAFDDGTELQLGPDASFVLDEDSAQALRATLDLGLLRARVTPQAAGRFRLRTPTCTLFVRGTDFEVRVLAGGRTLVELYQGALAVEDLLGNQTQLLPNERLQIDVRGLQAPERRLSRRETAVSEFRALVRAEAALDASHERERDAVGRELRLAELQQGRALVDVAGLRVRVEEYLTRPRSDQFKLVVLNERRRELGWFFYQGTFNRSLPGDLSVPLSQLPGCADAACDWFLTGYTTGRSNGVDSIVERAVSTLPGPVDVNSNGDAGDNVARLFDPATDAFLDVTGRSVFRTVFNQYGFYVNGRLKAGESAGNNITSESQRVDSVNTDPFTGAALTDATAWLDPAFPGQLATLGGHAETYPAPDRAHKQIYDSYSDGSFIQYDDYALDPDGGSASRTEFGAARTGTAYHSRILSFPYQQVVTSSHFAGRRIDLIVEPKILVQAGLLQ
ncbi:MAG: FecR domain-containing protein [Elusimicrobia bacterium]|nr:FecR domain-containing protein [Elusimicrobiota bacterium]